MNKPNPIRVHIIHIYIYIHTVNCFGVNVTIKEVKNLNGNQTDGNRIRKLTKNNSAFVSLPKVLAEECMKVFAKKCNHEGSPAILSRADNELRSKWH